MVGRCCCLRLASITFITRVGFSTRTLAYMLDSLVRVSRRVGKNHFGKIAQGSSGTAPTSTSRLRAEASQVAKLMWDAKPHLASRRRIQLSASPRETEQPFDVLHSPQYVRRTPSFTLRRINFYRFLLNDFKSFDSLFKVLFIFPSQYLFAIGFP